MTQKRGEPGVEWEKTQAGWRAKAKTEVDLSGDISGDTSKTEITPWLVWSNEHRMWWAPDRCGYRSKPDDAGRYTFDDAMSICRVRSWVGGVPPETMVHESAVWFGNHRPHAQSTVGDTGQSQDHAPAQ